MLVTGEPVQREIPHEPGQHFLLNRLSWKQLRKARSLQEDYSRESAKAWGAEFLEVLSKGGDRAEGEIRKVLQERRYQAANYDTGYLIDMGLAAWSYDASCDSENKAALDERTTQWAAQEIIDLTMPPSEAQEGEA